MKIQIKNLFSDRIILEGDYNSVKDCIEQNIGANLHKNYIKIQGTRHTFFYIQGYVIIGCLTYPVDFWRDNYEKIGKENGYTEEQIKEYGNYIKMADNIIKEEYYRNIEM